MAKLHPGGFDAEASDKARKTALSAEYAKAALLVVAQCIKDGKPLPMGIDQWLLEAIEGAIHTPYLHAPDNGDTGHALLVGLGLRSNNRRPKIDQIEVGELVQSFIDKGVKKTPAIQRAAKELEVSYGTVRAAFLKYRKAWDENSRISSEQVEMPPSLSD